jgi:hypothetical protein
MFLKNRFSCFRTQSLHQRDISSGKIPGGIMRRLPILLLLFVSAACYLITTTPQGFTAPPAAPANDPANEPKVAHPPATPATPATPKEKPLPKVDPVAVYKKNCGQCHLAFPPEFLPSGSWEKLLGSTEKHFEDSLEIDQKTKDIIIPYLKKNGAEFSKAKIPMKIVQSLEAATPLRITEVPYIIKKHRKIAPEDFNRKPIGTFSNCGACHLSADKWVFDKRIVIPEKEGAPPKAL